MERADMYIADLYRHPDSAGDEDEARTIVDDIVAAYRAGLAAESNATVSHRQVHDGNTIDQLITAVSDAAATATALESARAQAEIIPAPTTGERALPERYHLFIQIGAIRERADAPPAPAQQQTDAAAAINTETADGAAANQSLLSETATAAAMHSLHIAVDMVTIDTVGHYRSHRHRGAITVPLTPTTTAAELRAAIEQAARNELHTLREQGALPRRYAILYRDGAEIFIDNNADLLPIGTELVPLIASAGPQTETSEQHTDVVGNRPDCSPPAAARAFQIAESYRNFAVLQPISRTTSESYTHVLIDSHNTVSIEGHGGYVFPVAIQPREQIAPVAIITAGVQIAPLIGSGRVRPFFNGEVYTIIEGSYVYVPVGLLGGIELVWYAGPFTIEPSLALGIAVGGGFGNTISPFFLTAVGGNVKLLTGLQVARALSLFLTAGFNQWFTLYSSAPDPLRTNSTTLVNGYGGIEISFGISVKN